MANFHYLIAFQSMSLEEQWMDFSVFSAFCVKKHDTPTCAENDDIQSLPRLFFFWEMSGE